VSINTDNEKIVDFKTYCNKCKYRDYKEGQDPCNDCLDNGGREGTTKPQYFEER
jgi:hypothetical protein